MKMPKERPPRPPQESSRGQQPPSRSSFTHKKMARRTGTCPVVPLSVEINHNGFSWRWVPALRQFPSLPSLSPNFRCTMRCFPLHTCSVDSVEGSEGVGTSLPWPHGLETTPARFFFSASLSPCGACLGWLCRRRRRACSRLMQQSSNCTVASRRLTASACSSQSWTRA
jgi:hypothetical protein